MTLNRIMAFTSLAQTFTEKSMDGATNTFTNLPNSALDNLPVLGTPPASPRQLAITDAEMLSVSITKVLGHVAVGDIIKRNGSNYANFARGALDTILSVNGAGTDLIYRLLVNAMVDPAAGILQSKLAALVNADLPIGTAFQRKRTNSGVTALEDFTEEAAFEFVVGDGVAVIGTGIKLHLRIPFDCEITRWTMLSKEGAASIVIDVNRYTSLANFDAGTKLSITGSDTPDLVADKGDESTALTGWTTVMNQGDILEAEVDSASVTTRTTLILRVNKRG